MRLPVIPTILVSAAVVVMIGLGIWQLQRSSEKDALRDRIARHAKLPPMALPPAAIVDETLLFRPVTAFCLEVTEWRKTGGRSASGKPGTRFIAQCRTGVEGPGFAADMGVSQTSTAIPVWKGGEVTGRLIPEPSEAGFWDRITRKAPPARPMIVSFVPSPGFEASEQPTLDSVVNNSFAYAFQWFFFAFIAAVIYIGALRRRQAQAAPPPASPRS